MEKVPKVTVIVPVYNVEKYIKRCAKSLFEQTIDSLEILFIDDCGLDNSVEIIKETLKSYKNRNSLTRIINLPSNGGVASVRRQGIIEATGQYVIHCDGDDWVDLDLYERMYNKAIKENADVVICGLIDERINGNVVRDCYLSVNNGKEILKNWYKNTYHMSTCNKLVRRSIYVDNDILPWIGLNMWEDIGLFTRVFYYASRIVYLENAYYHYNRTNENAMTSVYGIKQVEQMIGIAEHLSEFFESMIDAKDFEKTKYAFQFLAKINLITDNYQNLKRYHNTFKEANIIIPEIDPFAFSNKGRFRYRMVRYHLAWLFVLMFKVKNWLH